MKQGWNDSSEYLSLFARSLHPGWQSTSSIQPWKLEPQPSPWWRTRSRLWQEYAGGGQRWNSELSMSKENPAT